MQELLAQLETHLRMAWRYRWAGLAAATLACVIGWTVVMLLPNVYRAETQVYIDTSSLLRPALQGLAMEGGMQLQALGLVRRTLLSRPNLESLARNTDLDLKAKTPKDFEALVDSLSRRVSIAQARGDNMFTIAFTDETPQVAHRVVETVLNLLVEKSLGESRKDTTTTKAFLDQQIREYESRLRQSEDRLSRFKQENMGLLPGQGGYFQRLEGQKQAVAEALLQLQEAQNRREQLGGQMKSVDQWITEADQAAYDMPTGHPLDARIAKLEEALDDMRLRYTDRHPDIVSTRALVEDLKAQRKQEVATQRAPGGSTYSKERIENPLFQQLQMALGAADAEVSALQARVEEYKRRQQDLGKLVDQSLQVEAEMGRLDRDYGLEKRNYDQLVSRRESLSLAEEATKSSDMVKFKIIEPPRVPSAPASPKRMLLNAGVLGFALAAGAAFAWLLGMLRPAVYSREAFQSFTELPVLGTVTRVLSAGELREHRLRIAMFAAGCLALVVGFGATVALEPQMMGIVSKLRDLGANLV